MSLVNIRCPVCESELDKTVYNNFADGYETIRNLIDILILDGGDNRRLNKVKNDAYRELVDHLFGELGTKKLNPEFLIYCMRKLRQEK